jgi:RND superfamily putative drug exporter
MGFAGRNIDRFRIPLPSRPAGTRGFWHRWSRLIHRRPLLTGLSGAAVVGVLVVPISSLHLGYPDDGNDPTSLTTRRAYDLMTEGFGAGFNGAFLLVADRGDDATVLGDLDRLRQALKETPGVAAVSPTLAAPSADAAVITVTPATSPQDNATKELLSRIRDHVVPDVLSDSDVEVVVGGLTAADVDQTNSISQRLPVFIGAVILLALLLLVAVFRSVVIAVQAAISNLISIVAAYGVIAYAAQGGWLGDLIGITTPTPIPAFIPMMMFAILFGLSMDYEVFLVSRIREDYLAGNETSTAIADGVASTGKVITAAALIMTAVFGAFVLDDQIFLKIIGIGMAAAVLVDATIIRLMLVPSVMQLLGRHNWWIPGWLDRLLPALDVEGAAPSTAPAPTPALENV